MKKVTILGAGLVGAAIAIDLQKNFKVTSVDINEGALSKLSSLGINTSKIDLSSPDAIKQAIADADIVVGAVPGFMGYKMLKAVLEAGKDIVDISFFPEDPFGLDELAKEKGLTAIVDCGVAPGMGNIILGYHNQQMKVQEYKCYVGGLPQVREWPYEYKAVFSPIDVIEEYIRPARYVQGGKVITRDALTDPELINFEKAGTLEVFNTDGLRSLIKTMDIPDMIEKTMRYPGCIEYLRVLRETGYFSYEEIEVNGQKIRPVDLTAKLLFPKWKLNPGEGDITVMRIIIAGEENGKQVRYQYDLHDEFDRETNTTSMARTTGYTCTAAVNLIANGMYTRKGISPPEYIGETEKNLDFVVKYLEERGVKYALTPSR